jgi:predicted phage baseplate assembly protein
VRRAGRYRPVLGRGPLTFSQPLAPGAPASRATLQDPREALPWIRVDAPDGAWTARPDLFDSHGDDRHFVVEMDDRRRAHLRFGDGEVGRALGAGEILEARYRVGNGPTGNVGADTITLVVATETVSGVTLKPRNPLAAMGGTAPEPASEVKLFAPYVRRELARAVTADDYASLAERHPQVQGAAAELRWNGSWYEARVAIDPLGRAEADEVLLQDVRRFLYHFRHIGHDLAVRPARYVAIDLALEVCVVPGFVRGHVEAALRRSLGARCLPDGSRGFFHPDELTFGVGVATSRLVAVAQAVPGVRSVVVRRLERLFEGPAGEIEQGLLSIGALEIARLDGDPSFPENGRIAFDMRGGR